MNKCVLLLCVMFLIKQECYPGEPAIEKRPLTNNLNIRDSLSELLKKASIEYLKNSQNLPNTSKKFSKEAKSLLQKIYFKSSVIVKNQKQFIGDRLSYSHYFDDSLSAMVPSLEDFYLLEYDFEGETKTYNKILYIIVNPDTVLVVDCWYVNGNWQVKFKRRSPVVSDVNIVDKILITRNCILGSDTRITFFSLTKVHLGTVSAKVCSTISSDDFMLLKNVFQ